MSGKQGTFDQELCIGNVQFEMTIRYSSRDVELLWSLEERSRQKTVQ